MQVWKSWELCCCCCCCWEENCEHGEMEAEEEEEESQMEVQNWSEKCSSIAVGEVAYMIEADQWYGQSSPSYPSGSYGAYFGLQEEAAQMWWKKLRERRWFGMTHLDSTQRARIWVTPYWWSPEPGRPHEAVGAGAEGVEAGDGSVEKGAGGCSCQCPPQDRPLGRRQDHRGRRRTLGRMMMAMQLWRRRPAHQGWCPAWFPGLVIGLLGLASSWPRTSCRFHSLGPVACSGACWLPLARLCCTWWRETPTWRPCQRLLQKRALSCWLCTSPNNGQTHLVWPQNRSPCDSMTCATFDI